MYQHWDVKENIKRTTGLIQRLLSISTIVPCVYSTTLTLTVMHWCLENALTALLQQLEGRQHYSQIYKTHDRQESTEYVQTELKHIV